MISLVLAILAFVCLFLAALGVSASRINLMAMGLTLWLLSTLVK